MKKALVIFSGGPDSTAAALWALSHDFSPSLLTFQFKGAEQYGELRASMKIAEMLNLSHEIVDFRSMMQAADPGMHILMHAGTPAYDLDKSKPHRAPFGAGMILSISANHALYNGFDTVIWGATLDDQLGGNMEYTQKFADKISDAVSFGCNTKFNILAPFSSLHKYQLFEAFKNKEELFATTWSCKTGVTIQSGDSHSCIARRLAARMAGINDRTTYKTNEYRSGLSEEQINNPESISDDGYEKMFKSDRPIPK